MPILILFRWDYDDESLSQLPQSVRHSRTKCRLELLTLPSLNEKKTLKVEHLAYTHSFFLNWTGILCYRKFSHWAKWIHYITYIQFKSCTFTCPFFFFFLIIIHMPLYNVDIARLIIQLFVSLLLRIENETVIVLNSWKVCFTFFFFFGFSVCCRI